ncbi:hypothetical protein [Acinetobacter wuhouensis]|uniref:hypothetical protein n=1 Tax=Acinetobacter wuhouensis TaxID=1879050 RepID=UPI001022DF99|nr:hypothetical protein [Acinetobacter wuhouensis]
MKNNVSISMVLMFFPTLAYADGVMPLEGIIIFGLILFVILIFIIYGLVCLLAKVGNKSNENE